MEQMTLFDDHVKTVPLASRLRPKRLEDFVGQEHLLGTARCGEDNAGGDYRGKNAGKLY